MSNHLPLLQAFSHSRLVSKSPDPTPSRDLFIQKRAFSPSKLTLPKRTKLNILPAPSLGLNPNFLHKKDYSPIPPLNSDRLRYRSPQTISIVKTSPYKDNKHLDLSFQQKTLITSKYASGKSLKTIFEKPEQLLSRKIQPVSELANLRLKHKDLKEKQASENPYLKKMGFLIDCYKETLQRKRVLWRQALQERHIRAESSRISVSPVSDLDMIPISLTPLPDIVSLTPNSVI